MSAGKAVRPGAWPVAIGGVGGSGTRVVAAMLATLGYHIGQDLNEAGDNLWFTLLFKHREVLDLPPPAFEARWRCFAGAMEGQPCPLEPETASGLLGGERAGQHPEEWLRERLASLSAASAPEDAAWAWKEPNTHMVVDRLLALHPGLRYVHVMRNGLDMALSGNQNQLRLWGPRVLGDAFEDSPRGSLAYWRWAHERILGLATAHPGRILVFNYDAMCEDPATVLPVLLDFLGVDAAAATIGALQGLVSAPGSRGRFRSLPRSTFNREDVDFVHSLGYPVA